MPYAHWLTITQEVIVPAGYLTPSFPSLYVPSFDVTQAERGIFIYEAEGESHHPYTLDYSAGVG
jgi:hypothetical protein